MKKIKYYKSKKTLIEMRKHALSLEEVLARLTPKQRERVEQEKKYFELSMKLRESREKKNLTQEKLAKIAKIPRTTVSKIESGNRNVTIETLMNLARAMGKRLEIRFV